MADIELVIKVSKDVYTRLFDNGIQDNEIAIDDICEMARALRLGIPLPKGHGRLIDADRTALLSDLFCYTRYTGIDEAPYEDATKALEFAPTIIEADTESEVSE